MYKVRAIVNDKPLRQTIDGADGTLERIGRLLEVRRDRYVELSRAKLTPYPVPVVYPIQWKSERQRRAFFATNGFGKGIPYVRTGRLGKQWTGVVRKQPGVVEFEVYNDTPYAVFVIGKWQQPFHYNTGWPQVDDQTVRAFSLRLAEEVVKAL